MSQENFSTIEPQLQYIEDYVLATFSNHCRGGNFPTSPLDGPRKLGVRRKNMYLTSIGDVIAVRDLARVSEEGKSVKVQVLIGIPKRFPDATDYYCPFQILGLGGEEIRYAGGVDAVQALQLVMSMIGALLRFYNEQVPDRLRWEAGETEGDFGFPTD